MTVDDFCYVCGVEGPCINGLCPDCTMNEFFHPGAAFAATFGAVAQAMGRPEPEPPKDDTPPDEDEG